MDYTDVWQHNLLVVIAALRKAEERRNHYDYGQGWHGALDAVEAWAKALTGKS